VNTSAARLLSAFLAARAAFGLAYLAQSLGRLPVPLYDPLERSFTLAAQGAAPPGLAMAWFGATALALAAAFGVGAIAWLASGRGPFARGLGRVDVVLAVARAGGLILLVDYAYFGWTLMRQTPEPLPLPSWYCPR
jgi:hypothetical protein